MKYGQAVSHLHALVTHESSSPETKLKCSAQMQVPSNIPSFTLDLLVKTNECEEKVYLMALRSYLKNRFFLRTYLYCHGHGIACVDINGSSTHLLEGRIKLALQICWGCTKINGMISQETVKIRPTFSQVALQYLGHKLWHQKPMDPFCVSWGYVLHFQQQLLIWDAWLEILFKVPWFSDSADWAPSLWKSCLVKESWAGHPNIERHPKLVASYDNVGLNAYIALNK